MGQMTIPCITSFDMNAQLLAWLQGKTGGKDKGEKDFVWIGHKDDKWVPKGCEEFQEKQSRGDMVCRNGCAFGGPGASKLPKCKGVPGVDCVFDDPVEAPGCAVLVNVKTDTGAAALNLPSGDIGSFEELHSNWIKSADCKFRRCRPSVRARRSAASARRRRLKSRRLRGDAPPPFVSRSNLLSVPTTLPRPPRL